LPGDIALYTATGICYNTNVITERSEPECLEANVLDTQNLLVAEAVTNRDGLARLGDEWRQLAQQSATATVFQTFEWNTVWWRRRGRGFGRRLCVLTFREGVGGRLVGLAPMMTSFWYATPLRRLSFLGTGDSDYLDLLTAPGFEDAVTAGFHAELTRRGGWQIADLHHLREGGLLRSRLPGPESGLDCHEAAGEPCPYLALPGDWDTLSRQLGKKTRSNISYYDRGLHKVYAVEASYVTEAAILNDEMTRLFDLHQRRWNQRWLPGVFGSRPVQRFHRDVAHALLERGWLRLFTLRLDGQTQASLYCFAFGDRLCYYQGGFEPTLAKWSLGTVLTAYALRTSMEEGRAVFDFLRGDEPYKAKWTGTSVVNRRRLLTRSRTPRMGRMIRRVQSWEETIERRAKDWMRKRR
jgi:CelD/BcsL family acetyltransferase involved in cellulose biosynthesis